jgi:hypothetical protein
MNETTALPEPESTTVVRVRPVIFTHEEIADMIEDRIKSEQPELYEAATQEGKQLEYTEYMLDGKFCGLVARWE